MKKLAVLLCVLIGISAPGCAATKRATRRKLESIIPVAIETTPDGYLVKDQTGQVWVLTVSPEGRLYITKVKSQ